MDIGVYNPWLRTYGNRLSPVQIHSIKRLNDAGTDDFSAPSLEYPNGVSAMATTAIGVDMPREAAIFGTLGEISLPDFQMAQCLRSPVWRRNKGKLSSIFHQWLRVPNPGSTPLHPVTPATFGVKRIPCLCYKQWISFGIRGIFASRVMNCAKPAVAFRTANSQKI